MKKSNVTDLHYIAPIENVPSILKYGILSYNQSQKLHHNSIAMQEIQEKRKNKIIPNAGRLHDYANLYFDAHNPMLSKLRDKNNEICILCIDPAVLDLPRIIIADQNASSDYVRFYQVKEGLEALGKDMLYAKYWKHQDIITEWIHKSIKCAELLVPGKIATTYILCAFVANQTALKAIQKLNIGLTADIRTDIFF
jgi:hypothetical protein